MKATTNGNTSVRVVVIDDEESVRSLLRRSLQRARCEVVGEASNGLDGARLAGELQPDVVVLDSMMPILGGEAAAALIREQAPETSIVAFSGELASCPEWADAYLNKGSGGLMESLLMVVGVSCMRAS